MAILALHLAHMILCDDLGEPRGLGEVCLMAARTKDARVRKLWNDRSWIGGVFCQRSVASLAIHPGMFSRFFNGEDVAMAIFTRRMPSETGFARRDFFQGVTAIMPVLPKALGDELHPCQEEDGESNKEDCRQPEEMLCVFEFGQGSILRAPHEFEAAPKGPYLWLK